MIDPNAEILRFADGLPTTIRGSVKAGVIVYSGFELTDRLDYDTTFAELIRPDPQPSRRNLYAAVRAIGILDFALSVAPNRENSALAELGNEPLSAAKAKAPRQIPLNARHLERAGDAWRALRAGGLSDLVLHRFRSRVEA